MFFAKRRSEARSSCRMKLGQIPHASTFVVCGVGEGRATESAASAADQAAAGEESGRAPQAVGPANAAAVGATTAPGDLAGQGRPSGGWRGAPGRPATRHPV